MSFSLRGYIIRGFMRALAILPFSWLQRLAVVISVVLRFCPGRMRRIISINIEHCFPTLDETERQNLINKTMRHTVCTGIEMVAFWFKPVNRLLPLVRAVYGEEPVKAACATGSGVILLGPHLGAWELVNYYLGVHYPMVTLYRPPKMEYFEQMIRRARERLGTTMMPTNPSGVKALYRSLASGKVIGILPDQDPGKGGGVFVPFLGIKSWTMSLVSRLAQKNQSPVFFVYAERLGAGKGFNIHFLPVDQKIYNQDIEISVAAMNRGIEDCVKRVPEQYQWSYKRFKTRPEGEEGFY